MTTISLGPTRVVQLCLCRHPKAAHEYNQGHMCEDCACVSYVPQLDWPGTPAPVVDVPTMDWPARPIDAARAEMEVARRVAAKRAREAAAMERALTVDALMADIKASLLVLRTLDNVPITDEQIDNRARNLVAGLIGNFKVERLNP